jgi:hypothetical protein
MLKKLLIIGILGLLIHTIVINPVTSTIIFSGKPTLPKIFDLSTHLFINLCKVLWKLVQTLVSLLQYLWYHVQGTRSPSHEIRDSHELYQLYQQVSEWSGLPWQVFWGIHAEETSLGKNLGTTPIISVLPQQQRSYFYQMCRELHWDPQQVYGSHKGAVGPFQFIPETWVRNAVDANGDGRKDPFDVEDAAYSAANYLLRKGGQADLRKALWHYNQDHKYIQRVMRYLRYT